MLKGQIEGRISVEDCQLIHDLAFLKKKKLFILTGSMSNNVMMDTIK